MRTYIHTLVNLLTNETKQFRCEAESFEQSIEIAEKNHPDLFLLLKPSLAKEQSNAAVNR
ncbi:hypothetical protein [Pseudomonas sp. DP-17]|uniref:hypothetical protein n=1 Tax=Pseudomonas sp. DP-17 TaxID=1580486 RepID=UPI001EFA9C0C|nr:hypothetical protein [Pseudomonas sp. DP-17]MCG8910978.1 hypothetical protein [Pseudomonas sp. DP-17]